MVLTCIHCKESGETIYRVGGKYGPACCACYQKARARDVSKYENCSQCRRRRFVAGRTKEGPICKVCKNRAYDADVSTHKDCSQCGKRQPVESRKAGKPICSSCYKKSLRAG